VTPAPTHWLPPLLVVDWNDYESMIARANGIFERDFRNPRNAASFRGSRISVRRHPEQDGCSAAFWHLVTEGPVEERREPVSSRMERIAWPRVIIDNAENPTRVCCWSEMRGREEHWQLTLTDFSYLVVLAKRTDHALLLTAYAVEEDRRRDKLRKAFQRSRGLKG
jgi:hypothetical protein